MENIVEILLSRGFIEQISAKELKNTVNQQVGVYCGFDPTSDSLHLGNLVALMGLAWFEKVGHKVYAIAGGATGMIGDPSGKKHERKLLDEETIQTNLRGITKNVNSILKDPVILNNFDWFKNFTLIDFLRDVGKQFRMGPMLGKDSVRTRLQSEEGMSFTEFSYQILQAYDFLYLFDTYGVTVQIGGSDQWGNITAGQELIRKQRSQSVFGMTFPLLTTSTGQKFGKSEEGAIWLSPEKSSPYELYQYLYRIPDADVVGLLYKLTFLPVDQVREVERNMERPDYTPNAAQKLLAQQVTEIVHGKDGVEIAQKVTSSACPGGEADLDPSVFEAIAQDMPSQTLARDEVEGQKVLDLFVKGGLLASKGDARRLIRNGGAYLNNRKIDDENRSVSAEDLIGDKMLLLGAGRKKRLLIRIS